MSYVHDEVKDVPWSIHIARIDRRRGDLRFLCTLGQGSFLGMSTVTEQVKALPADLGKPIAAINGDFFKNTKANPGDPEGVEITRGELISAPIASRSCFWAETNGALHITNVAPHFEVTFPGGVKVPFGLNEERAPDAAVLYTAAAGKSTRTSDGYEIVLVKHGTDALVPLRAGRTFTAQVQSRNTRGDSPITADTLVLSIGPKLALTVPSVAIGSLLRISTATQPDMSAADSAIGGGPAIVRGGKAVAFKGTQPRHPRSAIGWNDQTFFLVEVDGRQRTSAGMTLPELANYMQKLGCTEALNLDGGGSATLWVYGNVMNSPSEGRERPAANALVILQERRSIGAPPK